MARIGELIEPWFLFSFVWTLGNTTDNDGRKKFDKWLREKIKESKVRGSCHTFIHSYIGQSDFVTLIDTKLARIFCIVRLKCSSLQRV